MKQVMLFLSIIIFSCCSRDSNRLNRALEMAGKNRVELEKVLNQYSDDPADSLKYKSAVLLIENMPEKYGYKGTAIDKKIEAFGYLEKETDSIPADIVEIANAQFKERSEKVYDIKIITSEYLIEHIDIA